MKKYGNESNLFFINNPTHVSLVLTHAVLLEIDHLSNFLNPLALIFDHGFSSLFQFLPFNIATGPFPFLGEELITK